MTPDPTPPHIPEELVAARFFRASGDARVASENERAVMAEIWKEPGLPRAALGVKVHLTQQSLHRIATALEQRGLIRLGDTVASGGRGKPSPRLWLNPRFACAVGVSINTDSAGVTLMDLSGQNTTRVIRIDGLSMAQVLARVDDLMAELLAQAGFQRRQVLGIGFAISGFVVEGTQYNAPEPLAEWSALQLGPYLSSHFGLPVWTENGANTGALYEMMFGIGRETRNFVYLSFNYGFGGGLIMDGRLMRGGFGNAGELSGMFTMAESDDRPRLRSLLDMLRARGVDVRTIHDLSERFDPQWPGVEDWLARVAPHASRVINVLGATVDPEVVVFGGQIPRPLAEMMIARHVHYYERAPRHGIIRRKPRLVPSQMGGETAARGAALLPFVSTVF